jgi:hypothetical protein
VKILNEYNLGGKHYSLIERDDGSKIEIKGDDPIAVLASMPVDLLPLPQCLVEKTVMAFSDDELITEVERRASLKEDLKVGIISRIYNWIGGTLSTAWSYTTGIISKG